MPISIDIKDIFIYVIKNSSIENILIKKIMVNESKESTDVTKKYFIKYKYSSIEMIEGIIFYILIIFNSIEVY